MVVFVSCVTHFILLDLSVYGCPTECHDFFSGSIKYFSLFLGMYLEFISYHLYIMSLNVFSAKAQTRRLVCVLDGEMNLSRQRLVKSL